jgi:hypothetical protein
MNTIVDTVIAANSAALATRFSSVWNYYNAHFTVASRVMKDANLLANKLAVEHSIDFTVYAITGKKGRSAHSKTEVLLIALPAGHEIDPCGRRCRALIRVVDSK